MTTVRGRALPPAPRDVGQVLARMRGLDAALPHGDGVAVFNRVYLSVTEEVRRRLASGAFADERTAAELAVRFAARYLAAVEDGAARDGPYERPPGGLVRPRRDHGRGHVPGSEHVPGQADGHSDKHRDRDGDADGDKHRHVPGQADADGRGDAHRHGQRGGHARRAARPPACWRPLLRMRGHRGIRPIQFALAGINAHVGHDLALAVVDTCRASGGELRSLEGDFDRIGEVLTAIEERVREELMPGPDVLDIADPLTHLAGAWSLERARDAAWAAARLLWALRRVPDAYEECAARLDAGVGLVSRFLLTPLDRD